MQHSRGFSLIELMIVVAIVAILAAIALPAYQTYAIRARLIEGIVAVTAAKTLVASSFQSGGMANLARDADAFNAQANDSKYVQQVAIDPASGAVTISYVANAGNGMPTSLDGTTVIYTPQVMAGGDYFPLSAAASGPMDWACASDTHVIADARSMLATAGSLPSRYAPADCR